MRACNNDVGNLIAEVHADLRRPRPADIVAQQDEHDVGQARVRAGERHRTPTFRQRCPWTAAYRCRIASTSCRHRDEDEAKFQEGAGRGGRWSNNTVVQMLTPLQHLAATLKVPIGTKDAEGKRVGIFRDSAIENIIEAGYARSPRPSPS